MDPMNDDNEHPAARLREAMARITADTNKIPMGRGKQYTTVAARVEALRYIYGDSVEVHTEILVHPEFKPGRVENADVVVMRAEVRDARGRVLAVGHAEEIRGSSKMTETSALEVCETSAIGRALASLGLHGGEYASVNEIINAEGKAADGRIHSRQGRARPDVQPDAFLDSGGGKNNTPTRQGVPDAVGLLSGKDGRGESGSSVEPPAPGGGEPAQLAPRNPDPELGGADTLGAGGRAIAIEAFKTFAGSCGSIKELKSFWATNKKVLMELKDESPDDYNLVRGVFAKREIELKGADN